MEVGHDPMGDEGARALPAAVFAQALQARAVQGGRTAPGSELPPVVGQPKGDIGAVQLLFYDNHLAKKSGALGVIHDLVISSDGGSSVEMGDTRKLGCGVSHLGPTRTQGACRGSRSKPYDQEIGF